MEEFKGEAEISSRGVLILLFQMSSRRLFSGKTEKKSRVPELTRGRSEKVKMLINSSISKMDRIGGGGGDEDTRSFSL